MPKDTDELEDLHSSEQAEQDENPGGEAALDDAGSSPATDGTEPESLSIARDVIDAAVGPTEPAGSSPEAEGVAEAEPEEKPLDDENFTDAPFHKHKRFKQVLTRLKTAEVDATRYRNVETFLEQNGVGADEAADAIRLVALSKTDPVKAWEALKPFAERIALSAGVLLPNDLRERVERGEMTRETAIEVSKARAQVQTYQTREQLQAQQAAQRAAQEAQSALIGAAETWSVERQARDPNFEAKIPLLQREIAFLQATEGRPDTPQGVKEQCERAYKSVNTNFRPPQAAAPPVARKPAVRPVTGGQVAGNLAAPPKSTLDIINRMTGG